jgi:glutaminyl-peptide cyclotransferase
MHGIDISSGKSPAFSQVGEISYAGRAMSRPLPRCWLIVTFLFTSAIAFAACKPATHPAAIYGYKVIHTFPHDPNAFTQGLVYVGGMLYESTGEYGHSSLRSMDLQTGRVLQEHDLPANLFGEGLAAWASNLIQLTWLAHTGFVYDRFSFRQLRQFDYSGEGWGLTADHAQLILSDGSAYLRFLDPQTFRETGKLQVCADGQPVTNLNELEYIDGEVYANIWHADRIAEISLRSGQVTAWIDLHDLAVATQPQNPEGVLNGIAYDPATKRIFITGKLWPKLYEIKVVKKK